MTQKGRNPRRAYDRDGSEIPPATVRGSLAIRDDTIKVFCHPCHHSVIVSINGMPEGLAIPDIPIVYRLVCSKCGSKNLGVMLDVDAHYDRIRVRQGLASELPADRAVLRLDGKAVSAAPAKITDGMTLPLQN